MTARLRLNEKKGILYLILFTFLSLYTLLTEEQILSVNLPEFCNDIQIIVPNDFTAAIAKVSEAPLNFKYKVTRMLHGLHLEQFIPSIG